MDNGGIISYQPLKGTPRMREDISRAWITRFANDAVFDISTLGVRALSARQYVLST